MFTQAFLKHLKKSAIVSVSIASACGPASPLRIAVVGTGGSTVGAELAVADINAAGGIAGRLLELEIVNEPSESVPLEAIRIAERLAADQTILAVVGHGGSSRSLAASQVYNARGVPQIAPNTSAPLFTDAGPFSFRLVASDEYQGAFVAAHILSLTPAPRIAIIYVNDDYGRPVRRVLRDSLLIGNASVVYESPFQERGAFTEFADDLVQGIVGAGPDLLVWVGRPDELSQIRRRLKSELPNARVLGTDAVGRFRGLPKPALIDGDLLVSYVDLAADRADLKLVAQRFRSRTGNVLTDVAALTYDAIGVVAAGIRAGANTRVAMRKYLERITTTDPYQGIAGPVSFDENGDARPRYLLVEVVNSQLRRFHQ